MRPHHPDTLERTPPAEEPPSFTPLRRATTAQRALLFVIGPLLWLASVIAVAYVVHHGEAVLISLVVLAGALLFALLALVPMRVRRVREERDR